MLSLKDYVKETLQEICDGVNEADGEGNFTFHLIGKRGDDFEGTVVNFKVALGVTESEGKGSESKAKLGVLSGIVNGGVQGGSDAQMNKELRNLNEIEFGVYIRDVNEASKYSN